MTSPVLFISGPRIVSTPGRRWNGNTWAFTAKWSILAFRDDVHIELRRVGQIAVHQDRVCLRDADRPFHELGEILLAMDDLHPAAAEDVRRPDENRIADPGGDLSDFFEAVPRGGLRL